MRVPTRSAGTRSGVNWMRLNWPPTTCANVRMASVFARPATPSTRTWPRASRATPMRSSRPPRLEGAGQAHVDDDARVRGVDDAAADADEAAFLLVEGPAGAGRVRRRV